MAIDWEAYRKKAKKLDKDNYQKNIANNDIAPIRTTTTLTGDDIAPPVKTGLSFKDAIGIANEYKKKNSVFGTDFFKKPESFDDKEKAKSVGKAILGTGADFSLNVLTGVGNFAEGIGDTINYGIADISEKVGNKDFADALREETKKSVVQQLLGETTETVDKWSVLDKTSDSVAQGLGMITTLGAGGMALGGAGVGVAGQTALTTGGTLFSGVGSGMSEAYEGGATDEEARTYGLISGTAEALSEMLFGGLGKGLNSVGLGKGLSSADDMLAKKVSTMFSNQITKNLAEYGIKAGAEGFEEVLAGVAQAIGKKMTYMSEKDFLEILKEENLLEQFIVGSVTSGFAQVGDFYTSAKTGTDFISGLTENEQKVVDKEVENRIAEREEKGEKVTNKDKSKIFDKVVADLDKGYISIDTIESALGGETYDNYKSVTEQEDSLQKEFNTLNQMKQGEMTGEQIDKRAELKQQLEELKNNSKKTELKDKLSNNVFNLAKDSRLAESYNEKARRGQSFEADLSKYDTKQQEVIKKAVESGILNNTNRTHEFVDMIAKISADKGVLFDFTNNEKLKTSGFALKGKTVNGYKTDDGNIALNMQSNKALESVVGHEITHILEGTELYSALQEAVKQYATTKGEYVARMQSLRELYTGVYKGTDFDTKLQAELTADIVGDYLFSDSDFINSLSTEQPNLFKKIYNEIKYLCKVATAGSKEARELEKVKKAFDKAYKDTTKNTTDDGGAKYSISETTDGRIVAVVDSDILENIDTTSWDNTKKETAKKAATKALKQFSDGIVVDGITRKVNRRSRKEYTRSEYTEDLYNKTPDVFADKMRAADIADDIVVATTNWNRDGGLKHPRDDNFVDFDHGTTLIATGTAKYSAEVVVGITDKGEAVFYDVVDMVPTNFDIKNAESPTTATTQNAIGDIHGNSAKNSLPQNSEKSSENADFSLSDSKGRELSTEQREYFKDSKVRDAEGRLIPVYHGRVSEFNIFDREFSNIEGDFGKGFYFTDNEDDVSNNYANVDGQDLTNKIERYAERLEYDEDLSREEAYNKAYNKFITGEENTVTAYLNMKNPVYITPNEDGTFLDFDDGYDAEADTYYDASGEFVEFVEALNSIAQDYDWSGNFDFNFLYEYAYDNMGMHASDIVSVIKRRVSDELVDENGDIAINEIIRLAFEEIGYDGIIDSSVGYKFSRMPGMNTDTTHYIVFNSNQIKNINNKTPTENPDIRYSLSKEGEQPTKNGRFYGKDMLLDLPIRKDIAKNATTTFDDIAPMTEDEANVMRNDIPVTDADVPPEFDVPMYDAADTTKIDDTTLKGISHRLRETLSLTAKETKAIEEVVQKYSTTGLPDKTKIFDDIKEEFGEKRWKEYNEEIAEVKRTLKGFRINVSDKIKSDIPDYSDWKKRHQGRLNFSKDGLTVDDIYMGLSISYPGLFPDDIINPTDQLLRMAELAENDIYSTASQEVDNDTIQQATDIIYDEVNKYKENELAQHLAEEQSHFYRGITEEETAEGSMAKTVKERIADELKNARAELLMNQQLRDESQADYEKEISRLQAVYNGKRDKNTKVANDILRRIERLQRMKNDVAADYSKRISDIENRIAKLESKDYATVEQRKTKQQELKTQMENLVGDTSTWVDKKLGISYKVNTLRRNLRDIVRDANGKRNIAKADAIYDELQGKYNHNEAELNRESNRIKQQFAEMKITKAEDTYIQMLGELRHNPETTLTEDVVKDFYNKHKKNIDEAKVDKAIEMARPLYDDLLSRVNQVLSEQGMKEIPYRKGYFPHFTEDKQGFLAKLLNWKTKNNDIPTDIAGLTEEFSPNRSWQSFNKQRKSDVTDYSFLKGLDTYVQGSLDWIYHIEDIQKRRALENHIRYIHSEQGIKDRIDAIRNNDEYDANEMQDQIDIVYKEAGNPLNNFITDFRTATNTLAGKKSSLDRGMEEMTNRKFYSTMTNLSNRVSANMVGGSISSALTNFIPITQSWGQVSPISSLRAMGETIVSTFRDDGTINKSDFLTNRLRQSESLYKTNWDKIGDGVGFLMESIDSFTSQTIWRSKYHENISKGMSENAAIKNADQFAENVLAGRSRGNAPTIFDSKNPLAKIFTVFQLEVNNQYGYMFKDMPQDLANESKRKLVQGYVTMFLGAYAYNALYSSLVGRDAAFDPIGIIEDLMRDLGFGGDDDEEEEEIEPTDVILNLTNNIVEELPFVGGLLGGGRIPLSSALPYGGIKEAWEGSLDDWSEGNIKSLTKEWLNPVFYLAMPMGGGQLKKTVEGLKMFDDDLPIAGSYTDSGNLRFPVEDTPQNRVQAALFGQYANENARAYFDNDIAPLKEKQIQEYIDLDLPIADYWKVREGLKDLETLNEKGDYIGDLDLPISKKNILINNIADRDKPIDYKDFDLYSDFEEFDFATRYPEKYKVLQEQGISVAEYKEKYEESVFMYTDDFSWASKNPEKYTLSKAVTDDVMKYKQYTTDLYNIEADKDRNGKSISGSRKKKVLDYINGLDIEFGAKCILLKSEYSSEDRYNKVIVDYLIGRDDITYEEKKTILEELGATVDSNGYIHW